MCKKFYVVTMVLLMCFALITTGCSNKGEANSKDKNVKDRLVVWSYLNEGEPLQEWVDKVGERFKQEYPNVDLDIVFVGRDIMTKLSAQLQDVNSPEFPDIISNIDSMMIPLAEDNLLMDLSEALSTSAFDQKVSWKETFIPKLMTTLIVEEKPYFIPQSTYIHGFFYDKNMFKKYGISTPNTWDEFVNICETLKKNGIPPLAMDGVEEYYNIWYFIRFAERLAGPDNLMKAAKGEISFKDHPGFLEAAEYVSNFSKNEWYQDDFQGSAWPAAQVLFAQGKIGMIFVGAWLPTELSNEMPEEMEMGIFALPELENSVDARHEELWSNVYAIMKSSDSKDLAVEFLKVSTSMEMDPSKSATKSPSPLVGGTPVSELEALESIVNNATSFTNSYNGLLAMEDWFAKVFMPQGTQLNFGNISPEDFIDKLDKDTKAFYNK